MGWLIIGGTHPVRDGDDMLNVGSDNSLVPLGAIEYPEQRGDLERTCRVAGHRADIDSAEARFRAGVAQ